MLSAWYSDPKLKQFQINYFPMHRNPVQAQNRHKMNVHDHLKQKNSIYWWLKDAQTSEACKHCEGIQHVHYFLICMWSHSIVPDTIRLVHLFQELIETAQLTQLCIFNLNIPLLLGCLCTKIVSKIETSAQNTKTSEFAYFAHFLAWI